MKTKNCILVGSAFVFAFSLTSSGLREALHAANVEEGLGHIMTARLTPVFELPHVDTGIRPLRDRIDVTVPSITGGMVDAQHSIDAWISVPTDATQRIDAITSVPER